MSQAGNANGIGTRYRFPLVFGAGVGDYTLEQRVRGAAAARGVARQHALVDEVVDVAQGRVRGYLANFRPLSRRELSLEVAGERRAENADYSLQNMRRITEGKGVPGTDVSST